MFVFKLILLLLLCFETVFAYYRCNANETITNATKTISVYRNHNNDTWARVLSGANAASLMGEAYWLCSDQATGNMFSQFIVTVDSRWTRYVDCHHGVCNFNTDPILKYGYK